MNAPQRGVIGAETQDRTVDTAIFSRVLYQLSYLGSCSYCTRWGEDCQEKTGTNDVDRGPNPTLFSGNAVLETSYESQQHAVYYGGMPRIRGRCLPGCVLGALAIALAACKPTPAPLFSTPTEWTAPKAAGMGGEHGGAEGTARKQVIENKGSDTIVNLALAWAERYQAEHPAVQISVTGGGTGTGISALLNRTADIANASRQIQPVEVAQAEKNGIQPVEFTIARDAIAVIVHPQNPLDALSLKDIADIYTCRVSNWSQLGGEDRPIVRLSRETNSGTHVYFLEAVIRLGNPNNRDIFCPQTLLLPSSEGIITEVAANPNAIGYDGLGYVTSQVKVLAVSRAPGGEPVQPSARTVNAGSYPISRDLYMYTNGMPSGEVKAYLEWILSPEAQQVVAAQGFVPIPAREGN